MNQKWTREHLNDINEKTTTNINNINNDNEAN